MPNRLIDLTGQTFNHLIVIERSHTDTKQGKPRWNCVCVCGKFKVVSGSHLKNSSVKSCGCIRKDTRGSKHHLWSGYEDISGGWWGAHIITRDKNKNRKKNLKIEITKDDAWNQFIKQDRKCALTGIPLIISYRTSENNASIDRIDNNKNYTIDNIQWVHKHINYMKWVHNQDYFVELCRKVAEHNGIST